MKKTTSTVTPSPTSAKQYQETTVEQIFLSGVKTLSAQKVTTTYKVEKVINPEDNKPIVTRKLVEKISTPMSFDLVEVTVEELLDYRTNHVPCFVLKSNEKYYVTVIPTDISFVSCSSLGEHLCKDCNRLSAADDMDGGCAKVRNFSKCIEMYPWITDGIETFNTKHDAFIVFKCKHFRKDKQSSKKPSVMALSQLKLGLAQHI